MTMGGDHHHHHHHHHNQPTYRAKPYNQRIAKSTVSLPASDLYTSSHKKHTRHSRHHHAPPPPPCSTTDRAISTKKRVDAASVASAPMKYREFRGPPPKTKAPSSTPQPEILSKAPSIVGSLKSYRQLASQSLLSQATPNNEAAETPNNNAPAVETRDEPNNKVVQPSMDLEIPRTLPPSLLDESTDGEQDSRDILQIPSRNDDTLSSLGADQSTIRPISPPAFEPFMHGSMYSQSTTSEMRRRRRRKYFDRWGVPFGEKSIEELLQDRLVWVRYKEHYWWPAILYDNYRQIAEDPVLSKNVWWQMDFWKRMELARLLAFDRSHPRNHVLVARVLGKPNLELVEIEEYWAFETKVSTAVTTMACRGDYFWRHPFLYLEWHSAMDQVERILTDCLGEQVAGLRPPLPVPIHSTDMDSVTEGGGKKVGQHTAKSWVECAKQAERKEWASTCIAWNSLICGCADAVDDSTGYVADSSGSARRVAKLRVY